MEVSNKKIKSEKEQVAKKKETKQKIEKQEALPTEFTERMKRLLGTEYKAFYESYQKEAVRGLRLNLLKGTKEEFLKHSPFTLSPVLWEQNGFSYLSEEHPGKHPYHEAGVYYIQEPSAMAVAVLAAPKAGERVLDLCAAPGGKTTHLASLMKGQGLLVANEIHPARAKILSQNVERMGIRNAVVTNEDPVSLKTYFPEFFDRIVVDAPCSGEGMFRKDEIACLEWSMQNITLCAVRQREILECAAEMLKPGGRLVYSTCTFAPEEDEGTIGLFLEKHPEFVVETGIDFEKYRKMGFLQGHPEWAGYTVKELEKTFRLFPHRLEGEGHYIAVLRKDGEGGKKSEEGRKREEREKLKRRDRMEQKKKTQLVDWETFQTEMGFSLNQGIYQFFGSELYLVPEDITTMKGLRVLRAGLHLGTVKKNRLEPSHALALALSPSDTPNIISFQKDSKEIFSYLRGEMITLLALDGQGRKGWNLVCVDGYSIGWGKVSQSGMKNHYPKGLRWM